MEKSRFSSQYRNNKCLNCETPLDIEDRYCHFCGQLNTTKKLSFNDFFNEFFGSLFAYDSRLYRTLKVLLFKPGKISLEYIQGKRMKYANPFRFYLSISIIFFIIYGISNNFSIDKQSNQSVINFSESREEDKPEDEIEWLSEKQLDTHDFYSRNKKKAAIYFSYSKKNPKVATVDALNELDHENDFFNRWLYERVLKGENILENPATFNNYIISKLPFAIFLFIPVFTLVLWLTYGRSRYTYMEHLVFAFHVQTTLFFIFCFAIPLSLIGAKGIIQLIATLVFVWYLFKALRVFYQQGFWKTAIKFVFLNLIFIILASVTTMITALVLFAVY